MLATSCWADESPINAHLSASSNDLTAFEKNGEALNEVD